MTRSILIALTGLAAFGCGRPPELDFTTLTPDERTAIELSIQFEIDENLKWGRPTRVDPLGPGWETVLGDRLDCYQVRFATPEQEMPLLGDRAIYVNVRSRKVILAPRD
jgi:hypothetical protein